VNSLLRNDRVVLHDVGLLALRAFSTSVVAQRQAFLVLGRPVPVVFLGGIGSFAAASRTGSSWPGGSLAGAIPYQSGLPRYGLARLE
jgi:hypothetical protein